LSFTHVHTRDGSEDVQRIISHQPIHLGGNFLPGCNDSSLGVFRVASLDDRFATWEPERAFGQHEGQLIPRLLSGHADQAQ
jgi:hypothetical protein